ncbi:MAG: phytoene/squalene synthase family protein [Putridiphycobacter sp.]
MKQIFDNLSEKCSEKVTKSYSTSFYSAVKLLDPSIRADIHNIYGFVRFADEIVDTFHTYDKTFLFDKFEQEFYDSIEHEISLNPIINSFQKTIHKYDIDIALVEAFLKSMRMDLDKKEYMSREDYEEYIYGSADVVGLMCLKVFVNGNQKQYDELKPFAMKLGSAFQKVNFLRDIKDDIDVLERSYFPNVNFDNLDKQTKKEIINEIKEDFSIAYLGIKKLPDCAKTGVYTAYNYYHKLLNKLEKTPHHKILTKRVRVNNFIKFGVMMKSKFNLSLNLL